MGSSLARYCNSINSLRHSPTHSPFHNRNTPPILSLSRDSQFSIHTYIPFPNRAEAQRLTREIEIPDDITLEQFLNDPKHGRHPIAASRNPYTCGLTGKTYPYAEVVRRTELVARAVSRRLGFEARDASAGPGATEWDRVVGLFSLNTVDYIPLTHAVHRLGGIVTPASAAYSPEELEHQLRSSGARALFTCAPLLTTALKAADAVGIPREKIFLLSMPGGDEKRKHGSFATFDDLVAEGEGLPPTPPLNWIKGQAERQVAYLCYSSGTSGLPVSFSSPFPPFSHPFALHGRKEFVQGVRKEKDERSSEKR